MSSKKLYGKELHRELLSSLNFMNPKWYNEAVKEKIKELEEQYPNCFVIPFRGKYETKIIVYERLSNS